MRSLIRVLPADGCCRGALQARLRRFVWDVAVFLRDFVDRWPEMDRIAAIETNLLDETGAWQERSPLMGAIRRDGIDL